MWSGEKVSIQKHRPSPEGDMEKSVQEVRRCKSLTQSQELRWDWGDVDDLRPCGVPGNGGGCGPGE